MRACLREQACLAPFEIYWARGVFYLILAGLLVCVCEGERVCVCVSVCLCVCV